MARKNLSGNQDFNHGVAGLADHGQVGANGMGPVLHGQQTPALGLGHIKANAVVDQADTRAAGRLHRT